MKRYRRYFRDFMLGVIVAALALGSLAIKATHPDTPPEQPQCHPFGTGRCEPSRIENCQPYYPPILWDCDPRITWECPNGIKPYEKDTLVCPQIFTPCPLEKSEQGTTQ